LGAVFVPVPSGGVGIQFAFYAGTCVQRVLIDLCLVDVFDDINLSVVWPLGTNGPEGRPYGRTMSELPEIGNEETTVISLLASDADRSPFTTGGDVTLAVDL
jgi:hypothetical protein